MLWRLKTSTSTMGSGCLLATEKFINANRGALAVSHAIDDQARAEDAVAAGKDSVRRGHQSLRVYRNQPAREISPRRLQV